jgi:nicotinamidase-related amidase
MRFADTSAVQTVKRIRREQTCLLVVDVQVKLLSAINKHQKVVENTRRLVAGASLLRVPVLATEQYPKGLGATAPKIAAAIKDFAPMEKLAFSACRAPGFSVALKAKNVPSVIMCGIEAHVCVLQTCLDLLDDGYNVFVVADAVSSRTAENRQLGLERMRAAGATIVSTEMVLFELLEKAGSPEFKQIISLIK